MFLPGPAVFPRKNDKYHYHSLIRQIPRELLGCGINFARVAHATDTKNTVSLVAGAGCL